MDFTSATIIGMIGASLTTFAFLPQAVKTIRTKNTRDLSLFMYLMAGLGTLMWLIYGILISDLPIIMANTVSSFFVFTIIIMKVKYK